VEIYQFGTAVVEIIKQEPIITQFIRKFEFVHNDQSLGFWFIPENCSNFELVCLGLKSIFRSFSIQKDLNQEFKLDIELADLIIGKQ